MYFPRRVLPSFLMILFASFSAFASNTVAGIVQLELIGDTQGTAFVFQEWAQALGKAGIENVRIRSAEDSDKVGIETRGSAENPIYVVTGIIRSHDELQMPGRTFHRVDVAQLARWIKDLADHGPTSGKKEPKAAFGLTSAEMERVHNDLATPVSFHTQGVSCRLVVEKIAKQLQRSLEMDESVARALDEEKMAEELSNLSCGTALAYALHSAGYGFLPHSATGGEIAYTVTKMRPDLEVWPVGHPSEKSQPLPALFEFLNVNIQNVSAAKALEAIGGRIKSPVLLDSIALTRHGIDPSKAIVSLPPGRTTYGLALRKLLFKAHLKFEVRCDETETPFLWVTSVKPN
jgi:hypothetical protein